MVFTIYGRGGHLGHVTWISRSNFREKHILFHCPRYDVYRNQLFAYVEELCPRFKELNVFEKFNYLFNSDGPIVKAVARFFYKANTIDFNDSNV